MNAPAAAGFDAGVALEAGLAAHRRGDLASAEAAYRRILDTQPDHPDALHLLGVIGYETGNVAPGIDLIQRALVQRPRDPTFLHNLGNAYREARAYEDALASYRAALAHAPRLLESQLGAAAMLRRLRRLPEAQSAVRRVLAAQPANAEAHLTLGNIHDDLLRAKEAEAEYRRALALDPLHAGARVSLAGLLAGTGRYQASIAESEAVLAAWPDHVDALVNLAAALAHEREMARCLKVCERLIALAPGLPEAHKYHGNALMEFGRLDEAIEAYRGALRLDPLSSESAIIALMNFSVADPAVILEAARGYGQRSRNPALWKPLAARAEPERRLRVGYVSPDLRRHSVTFFFEPVLERHDRERFEVVCYYTTQESDAVTERLRGRADAWVHCAKQTPEEIAERVRADGIDILIDLAGHTTDNSLEVFHRRPAPLQMTFLGYPGTTGLEEVDYRITDNVVDPPGEPPIAVEEPLRLEASYYCYRPLAEAPPVAPLPALRRGRITFGSFNNRLKIGRATLDLWSAVLAAVPESDLLLKSRTLSDKDVADSVLEQLVARGVDASRVRTTGYISTDAEHLALYGEVDVGLDTHPYNGATTTCEALWMGVPVVVLRGTTHASRMGESILRAAGLEELVAVDADAYVNLARSLSADPEALARRRATLRERLAASRLMDEARFVAEYEALLRGAWRRWCETRPG